MEDGIVTGTSDMLSGIDSNFFEGADPDPQETPAEGADSGDVVDVDAADAEPEPEAAAEEPVEQATEEEPVEDQAEGEVKTDQPAQPADLPEGVRLQKNRKGEDVYVVEPKAWEGFSGSHKLVQEVSELIGEPLTRDALEVRDRAYNGQEAMYTDFLSGDTAAQTRFIEDFILTANDALQAGQIENDPLVPFATTMFKVLAEKSPEASNALRWEAASSLIDDLYEEAAVTGNQNVFNSVGHIAKILGMADKVKPSAKMQEYFTQVQSGQTREKQLEAENARLKAQVEGKQTSTREEQFTNWKREAGTAIITGLKDDAIRPLLAETQKAWEAIPDGKKAFDELVLDRVYGDVKKTIHQDSAFVNRIAQLDRQAKLTTSPQVRQRIADQIKQAYINKAKLVVQPKLKEAVTVAANLFKEKSQQAHARRAAAQGQRVPKGTSAPAPKSLVPGVGSAEAGNKAGTMFNPRDAARDAARLIAAV